MKRGEYALGYSSGKRASWRWSSVRRSAAVAPGVRRATTCSQCELIGRAAGSSCNVNQSSGAASVPPLPAPTPVAKRGRTVCGGSTPTTRVLEPPTSSRRPMIARSPPKRAIHDSCESSATDSAPGRSSSGRSGRPIAVRIPSVSRRLAVSETASTRTASPSVRSVVSCMAYAPTLDSRRDSDRKWKYPVGDTAHCDSPVPGTTAGCRMVTSCSGCGYGNARSTTASSTL